MSTKLEDLAPDVKELAEKCIGILVDWKIPHAVTSTFRTEAEQKALYAQGRQPIDTVNGFRYVAGLPAISTKENSYTVTNCDGVTTKSNHQSGRALDIVPVDENGRPVWPPADHPGWKRIADIMRANGFRWGGDWPKFPDLPHYEA